MKKNYALKSAFSLMEMMIVLLIVAIIAAATAPMVSKKMLMSATSGDSPWVFANTNGTIAYNMGGKNMSAIIGASSYDANGSPAAHPRLVLSAGGDKAHPAMVFATGSNGKYLGQINMTDNIVSMQGGTGTVGTNSVAMGMAQQHGNTNGTTAIGYGTTTKGILATAIGHSAIAGNGSSCSHPTAIGSRANATGSGSVAIGGNAASAPNQTTASGASSVAIGQGAQATGGSAVVIGAASSASNVNSVAIGNKATASHEDSVAIGPGATTDAASQIRLGTASHAVSIPGSLQLNGLRSTSDNGNSEYLRYFRNSLAPYLQLAQSTQTVYIPGNLVVDGITILGADKSKGRTYIREMDPNRSLVQIWGTEDGYIEHVGWDENAYVNVMGRSYKVHAPSTSYKTISDRRSKNVGKKYEAGVAELKKLDLYHFTFKNDKDKTPQVGVMAQDLQKVFPDAVTKGHDGYLRIRWDEMFYAVINAVKELDTRVTALTQDVKSYFDKTTKLEETVKAQQKTIEELEQRIAKLENK